jgi:predicted CoA-binding protein
MKTPEDANTSIYISKWDIVKVAPLHAVKSIEGEKVYSSTHS